MTVNPQPGEADIQEDAAEQNPERWPGTVECVRMVFPSHRKQAGNEGDGEDENVVGRKADHFGRLAEGPEQREANCERDHDEEAKREGERGPMPERFLCIFRFARAVCLRDPNRDRSEEADAENERHDNDRVSECRRRQRSNPETPDHHGVGHTHEHLPELAGDERQRELQRVAAFALKRWEHGGRLDRTHSVTQRIERRAFPLDTRLRAARQTTDLLDPAHHSLATFPTL